jgi:hypothetical protein
MHDLRCAWKHAEVAKQFVCNPGVTILHDGLKEYLGGAICHAPNSFADLLQMRLQFWRFHNFRDCVASAMLRCCNFTAALSSEMALLDAENLGCSDVRDVFCYRARIA